MKVIFAPLAQRQLEKLYDDIAAEASEERADGYIWPRLARGTRREDTWLWASGSLKILEI